VQNPEFKKKKRWRGCGRVKIVQILCTFVTGKMLTVETIPGMEGRGDKRE
jgi:hypothetical protein